MSRSVGVLGSGSILVCCVVWGSATAAQESPRPGARPPADARRELLDDVLMDLRRARELAKGIRDARLREQLDLILSRATLKAGDLAELLWAAGYESIKPGIAKEELDELTKAIKGTAFDKDRLPMLKDYFQHRSLTSLQAASVLRLWTFDDGRIEAAVILYPALADPENFFKALQVFTFDSSRDAVRKRLNLK